MLKNDMGTAAPVGPSTPLPSTHGMLNKVPEVTVYFWIIKVLCTTVGETASDFLNVNLGLGLQGTSIAAGIALLIAMVFQFRANRYVPAKPAGCSLPVSFGWYFRTVGRLHCQRS